MRPNDFIPAPASAFPPVNQVNPSLNATPLWSQDEDAEQELSRAMHHTFAAHIVEGD